MMLTATTDHAGFEIATREKRYPCAELVDLTWNVLPNEDHHEYAILAEIWTSGAVFLLEEPARRGAAMTVALPHGTVTAKVLSCRKEKCSWAVEVQVEQPEDWFGGRYQPAVLVLGEVLTRPPRKGPQPLNAWKPMAAMLHATIRRSGAFHNQPRAS